MNRLVYFLKFGLVLLLIPLFSAEESKQERVLCQLIRQGLEIWHVRPLGLDDALSRQSLSLYEKSLDSSKSFLLESDIRQLQAYEARIDDEVSSGSLDLSRLGAKLLRERIILVQQFTREILTRPFDFGENEAIALEGDKRGYCRTPEELKGWWRRQLKYFALTRILNAEKADSKPLPKKEPQPAFSQLEEKVRKEVAGSMEGFFRRLLQERPEETRARLLNAVISSFDPHSRYFPPRDKEEFDIQMSGTLEGIGVLLGEENGMVTVLDVIPGSPAWLDNQIKIEDVLIKVAQAEAEAVDVLGMSVSDVARLVRGRKGTTVRLTVRKPDGRLMEVPLVRNIIEIKETYARSAILQSDQLPARVGYVYLPSFYRDFYRENGRSSAEDVRRELVGVKEQKVDGVILDLRSNSGGALDDAVRLAGLFIDKGPVVQMKDRRATPQVYHDDVAGVVYDGPLVVLVNAISASASEIVAAALQDYGRAVIIGGSHTFGKGTVQMMVDLDKVVADETPGPLGSMTLTVQKYYRVSGSSTQFRGVVPDIVLPEPSSYLEIGEKYLEHALPWDTVAPVPFVKWSRELGLADVVSRSAQRVGASDRFRRLAESYEWLQSRRSRDQVSLNLEQFRSEQQALWKRADEVALLEKLPLPLKVLDGEGKPAPEGAALDAEQKKRASWLGDLANDEMVDEAVRVIADLARPSKK